MNNHEKWNRIWKNYAIINKNKIKFIYHLFNFPNIPRNNYILDLGCGTGDFLDILKYNGFKNIFGIEPQSDLIKDKELNIKQSSILDEPDLNYINKFDIIIITGVLHHLKDREEIKLSLSNIIKYTKKGSLVFLVEPRNSTLRKLATIALIKSPEFIFKLLPLRCYLERELLLQEKIEMNKYLAYAHLLNQDFKKYNIMPVTIKEDWKMQYNVYVVN